MITLPYDIGEKVYALNEFTSIIDKVEKRTPISIHVAVITDYCVSANPPTVIVTDLEDNEWEAIPIRNVSTYIHDLIPKLIL